MAVVLMAGGSRADVEVAVIGAGPHGLAAGVHLRRAGVRAHVLGEPMSFWRTMPEGMRLRSNMSASNLIEPAGPLSLRAYGEEIGRAVRAPISLADFVAYGEWVQRRGVPDVDRREVLELHPVADGFALGLAGGELLRARRVVVAGGIVPFARVPVGFEHLPPARVSHSAWHRDPAAMRGRRVCIVGGGQSAFELAVLFKEAGATSVDVLVRATRIVWLRGHSVKRALGGLGDVLYAPTDVGPLWYSRLVERPRLLRALPRAAQDRIAARCIRPACAHFVRVRLGGVEVSTGVQIAAARASGEGLELELSDGTLRHADHLVLATGYRVDFAAYPFLGEGVRSAVRTDGGFPVLGRGLETTLSGLHVMGAPAARSFGPIMRFVSGSWYGARTLAASLRPRRRVLTAGARV